MYREEQYICSLVLSVVSGIHWEVLEAIPMDKGGRLYLHLSSGHCVLYYLLNAALAVCPRIRVP